MSSFLRALKSACLGLTAFSIIGLAAGAFDTARAADPRTDLKEKFTSQTKGKKVAWVPVWMGVLESEWTRVMQSNFENHGIELITRDPNFKSDVQLQAVSTLINRGLTALSPSSSEG